MAPTDATHLPLHASAERVGIPYETIRQLAKAGVFTVTTFSAGKTRPPIFLSVAELDAWKRGGLQALRELQAVAKPAKRPSRTSKARA
jgi:hypothetical protein